MPRTNVIVFKLIPTIRKQSIDRERERQWNLNHDSESTVYCFTDDLFVL